MKKEKIPHHLGIIMDGNRRWAKKRGLSSLDGHKRGFQNFKKIAEECYVLGVRILTVYAFSSENWKRSGSEVNYLMRLFSYALKKELGFIFDKGIKLNVMGRLERLPKKLREEAQKAVKETSTNKNGILNIALSYGGRQEIADAAKKIIKDKIPADKIDENTFGNYIYTAGQPDPDLIIRTGGERRLSGFLPWQSVYSELFFSDKMWPDFSEKDLKEIIKEYQRRQRRFGQ